MFNQTQSHHQLQRMLPEGAHSLGKPRTVCLFTLVEAIGFMGLHPIKIETDNNRNVAIYKFITLYLSLTVVGKFVIFNSYDFTLQMSEEFFFLERGGGEI